jgi:hypothetical protein
MDKAWIVLLSNDDYLPGLLLLAYTLKEQETAFPLVVQALPGLSATAREVIAAAGIEIIESERILPVCDFLRAFCGIDWRVQRGKNGHKVDNFFRQRFIDAFS